MGFREAADPGIDPVDAAVGELQRLLHTDVGRDLGERRQPRQAVGRTDRVVVGDAVVSSALDVERSEVEATLPRRSEEEIPHVVNDPRVDLLGPRTGEVLHDRIDADLRQRSRVKESVAQQHGVADINAVRVQEIDVFAEHAVADAERHGGKLRRDAGVHVGPITSVGRDAVGAGPGRSQQRG